jgi:raffinose/stachyose/melibiose transport system substrate-binding protein
LFLLLMAIAACSPDTTELDAANESAANAAARQAEAEAALATAQAEVAAISADAAAGQEQMAEAESAAEAAAAAVATAQAEAAAAQADAEMARDEARAAATAAAEAAAMESEAEEETMEEVTLAVWYLSQNPEEMDLIRGLNEEFMAAHPNITIEFSAYGFEDMNNTLRLALDGGVGPDVAYSSPGPSHGGAYAAAGHLVDLMPAATELGWTDRFNASVMAHYDDDFPNSLHQMPFDLVTVGVYYNTEIYDELELEPPQTLEEFESQLATIRDAGYIPISVGALDGWPLAHIWDQFIHTSFPYDYIESIESGDPAVGFDDPRAIAATERINSWAENGYFQDNVLATAYADGNNLFINGEAAINIGGTWNNSTFAAVPEFDVGFFALPQVDPALDFHMGGFTPNNAWMIPAYSEHQEEAITYVDFMLGEEVALAKWNTGEIPAYQFAEIPEPVAPLQADVYQSMQNAMTGTYLGNFSSEVQTAIWNNLQAMVAGDLSPEEAMTQLNEVYQQIASE